MFLVILEAQRRLVLVCVRTGMFLLISRIISSENVFKQMKTPSEGAHRKDHSQGFQGPASIFGAWATKHSSAKQRRSWWKQVLTVRNQTGAGHAKPQYKKCLIHQSCMSISLNCLLQNTGAATNLIILFQSIECSQIQQVLLFFLRWYRCLLNNFPLNWGSGSDVLTAAGLWCFYRQTSRRNCVEQSHAVKQPVGPVWLAESHFHAPNTAFCLFGRVRNTNLSLSGRHDDRFCKPETMRCETLLMQLLKCLVRCHKHLILEFTDWPSGHDDTMQEDKVSFCWVGSSPRKWSCSFQFQVLAWKTLPRAQTGEYGKRNAFTSWFALDIYFLFGIVTVILLQALGMWTKTRRKSSDVRPTGLSHRCALHSAFWSQATFQPRRR